MPVRDRLHTLLAGAFAVGLTGGALAPAKASTIFQPDKSFAGKSIANWTAAWWTWTLQAPAATSPILDQTGEFAHVDNNGPVFFIGGNLGGTLTRSFTVPVGSPILLPIINFIDIESVPPDPPGSTLADRVASANIVAAAWLNAVTQPSLFASIDSNAVVNPSSYLEQPGLFSLGVSQPGSLLDAVGVTAGTDAFPAKSAGYYLMIQGLSPGLHTLDFGGSSVAFNVDTPVGPSGLPATTVHTTDFINVVPRVFLASATIRPVPEPASGLTVLSGILGLALIRRYRSNSRQ